MDVTGGWVAFSFTGPGTVLAGNISQHFGSCLNAWTILESFHEGGHEIENDTGHFRDLGSFFMS